MSFPHAPLAPVFPPKLPPRFELVSMKSELVEIFVEGRSIECGADRAGLFSVKHTPVDCMAVWGRFDVHFRAGLLGLFLGLFNVADWL